MSIVWNTFREREMMPTCDEHVPRKVHGAYRNTHLPWKEDNAYRDEHVPWKEGANAQPDKDDVDHSARILWTGPAAFQLSFHFHF